MGFYVSVLVEGADEAMYGRVILTRKEGDVGDVELYVPVGGKTDFFDLQVSMAYFFA